MDELRNGAICGGIGKSVGKGLGIVSKIGTSTTKPTAIQRTTSQDPEVGHMNVGWITHNTPREH